MLESAAGEKHGHVPSELPLPRLDVMSTLVVSSIVPLASSAFQVGAGNLPSGERVGFYEGKLAKLIFIEPVVT